MFLKSFALVFLASLATAKIPSYMKICGRRNPNLEQCVLDSAEGLRERLRQGMPELEVEPMDPLSMPGFLVADSPHLKIMASDVKTYGLADYQSKSFHVDFEKQTLDIVDSFPKITVDAIYDIDAKILVPIVGKGHVHITSDDVEATASLKWKIVKKKGADYMFFTSMTTKLNIKDYQVDFQSPDGPDSPLAVAINSALEGGRKEILETVRPTTERVISEEVLKRANQICTHFTYDELWPDRE